MPNVIIIALVKSSVNISKASGSSLYRPLGFRTLFELVQSEVKGWATSSLGKGHDHGDDGHDGCCHTGVGRTKDLSSPVDWGNTKVIDIDGSSLLIDFLGVDQIDVLSDDFVTILPTPSLTTEPSFQLVGVIERSAVSDSLDITTLELSDS